jgi:hypothetical protein
VLAKIKETSKLTDRERAYIAPVRLLYGEGDKPCARCSVLGAMEKVYLAYPEDLDAAAFYSLSLLGYGRRYERLSLAGESRRDRARVLPEESKSIPAQAHYIIHAFDDPITQSSPSRPRVVTPASRLRLITRVTCRRIFFCNSACGPEACGVE